MGIKSTYRYFLYLVPNFLHEHIVLKPSIFGIVMTDTDYYLLDIDLRGPLELDCLVEIEALLKVHIAEIVVVI